MGATFGAQRFGSFMESTQGSKKQVETYLV